MLLILVSAAKIHNKKIIGRRLFPFLKWSLRFLTVDATKPLVMIDVIYSRYNKENNTFFNSLRKNDVEAQVEITLKVMDRARVNCY